MKKLIIEIKQTASEKKSDGNNIVDDNKDFQNNVKDKVSAIRNPIGAIKSEINDIAGAKGLAIAGATIAVAQEVVGQISASVNFAISGVGMMTGDSSLQETIAREQEKVDETLSMAKSSFSGAATGAVMGAAGGPIGVLVGAVGGALFGAITAETNKQRKYEERRREYEYSAWKMDTARSINLQRSGVTIGSGRLHQY